LSIEKSPNKFVKNTKLNRELVWPKIEAPLGKSQHFFVMKLPDAICSTILYKIGDVIWLVIWDFNAVCPFQIVRKGKNRGTSVQGLQEVNLMNQENSEMNDPQISQCVK
jgi:hypothetical protein